MAIQTNGRLHNILQTYPPNARVQVVVNGQHLEVGSIRCYRKEMRIEICTSAMSDEELFADENDEDALRILKESLEEESNENE